MLWHPRGNPNRVVGELPGHVQGVLAIGTANLDNEHQVATLSGAGTVTLWDLRTFKQLQRMEESGSFPCHEDMNPSTMAFDPGNRRLLTATRRPCLWAWNDTRDNSNLKKNVNVAEESKLVASAAHKADPYARSTSISGDRSGAPSGDRGNNDTSEEKIEEEQLSHSPAANFVDASDEGKKESQDGKKKDGKKKDGISHSGKVDEERPTMLGETWRRAHSLLRLAEIPDEVERTRRVIRKS